VLAAARLPLTYTVSFVAIAVACLLVKAVAFGDPDAWGEHLASDLLGVAGGLFFGAAGLNALVGRLLKRNWARETSELVNSYTEIAVRELASIADTCIEIAKPALDTAELSLAPVKYALNLYWFPNADGRRDAWSDDQRRLVADLEAALIGTQNRLRDEEGLSKNLVDNARAHGLKLAQHVALASEAIDVIAEYRADQASVLRSEVAAMKRAMAALARDDNSGELVATLNFDLYHRVVALFDPLARIVADDGRATQQSRAIIAG
jgi:hypothetical protein